MTSLPSHTLLGSSALFSLSPLSPLETLVSAPDSHLHRNDGGTRGDVLDETAVERPRGEVGVVLLGESGRGGEGLDTAKERERVSRRNDRTVWLGKTRQGDDKTRQGHDQRGGGEVTHNSRDELVAALWVESSASACLSVGYGALGVQPTLETGDDLPGQPHRTLNNEELSTHLANELTGDPVGLDLCCISSDQILAVDECTRHDERPLADGTLLSRDGLGALEEDWVLASFSHEPNSKATRRLRESAVGCHCETDLPSYMA